MTKEKKAELLKSAYYITQYDVYSTFIMFEWIKENEIDPDLLIELFGLMPEIRDDINQKIYDVLFTLDDEKIASIIKMLEAIKDNDMNEIDNLGGSIYDYMAEHEIYTPDDWEQWADDDLKANGIEARCLYWVKEIDFNYDYLEINGYCNGFNGMDANDICQDWADENFSDWLDNL